jgi:hypothetical protein
LGYELTPDKDKSVVRGGWNSFSRGEDPGQVQRISGTDAESFRRGTASEGAQLADGLGQSELLS